MVPFGPVMQFVISILEIESGMRAQQKINPIIKRQQGLIEDDCFDSLRRGRRGEEMRRRRTRMLSRPVTRSPGFKNVTLEGRYRDYAAL